MEVSERDILCKREVKRGVVYEVGRNRLWISVKLP